VECIVGLGRTLGLVVVAEGVETAQQLRKVTSLGADLAQGYHLSHPLAPADLEKHITGRTSIHLPLTGSTPVRRAAAAARADGWSPARARRGRRRDVSLRARNRASSALAFSASLPPGAR
jgi:predicted signal transduction protein with EAL and GGDEF domain